MKIRNEYRSGLLALIFGKNKEWAADLSNALYETINACADDISITAINDVLCVNIKNEVTLIVSEDMLLYESYSANLQDIAMEQFARYIAAYGKYLDRNYAHYMYNRELIKLPTPKCICFYSNTSRKQNEKVVRLSEEDGIGISIKMLNICKGQNEKLLNLCSPLREYSDFVDKIRELGVETAFDSIPDDAIIKLALLENKSEIMRMCE